LKRWLLRIAKGVGALVAALALALGVWALVPVGTRAIAGAEAIAEVRHIEIGGFAQTLLLRGVDRRNPVLLYVHGGPGSAQLPIARLYSTELEEHFVVAHWDQRGAGASCARAVVAAHPRRSAARSRTAGKGAALMAACYGAPITSRWRGSGRGPPVPSRSRVAGAARRASANP